jgi:hypothetical protein
MCDVLIHSTGQSSGNGRFDGIIADNVRIIGSVENSHFANKVLSTYAYYPTETWQSGF